MMKIECEVEGCGRIFKSQENYEYHVNVHKNTKPYECKKCSAAFRNGSHLRLHVAKAHGGGGKKWDGSRADRNKLKGSRADRNKLKGSLRKMKAGKMSGSTVRSGTKSSFRSLYVQIRPEDLNQVRKYRQLKESLFWKRSMHHLFIVPFNVLNPKFSQDPSSNEFWYTPNMLPYRDFVPICKLPEELRVIHDPILDTNLNRANRGWESALAALAGSSNKIECELTAKPWVVMNRVPFISSQSLPCPAADRPTAKTHFDLGSPDCRLCPYCKKFVSKEKYYVHVATHKGHGFRIRKCGVCGLCFVNHKRFSEHLKLHITLQSQSQGMNTNSCLYDGMPTLTPVIL